MRKELVVLVYAYLSCLYAIVGATVFTVCPSSDFKEEVVALLRDGPKCLQRPWAFRTTGGKSLCGGNDCLKTAVDEIQWIEAAGNYPRIVSDMFSIR